MRIVQLTLFAPHMSKTWLPFWMKLLRVHNSTAPPMVHISKTVSPPLVIRALVWRRFHPSPHMKSKDSMVLRLGRYLTCACLLSSRENYSIDCLSQQHELVLRSYVSTADIRTSGISEVHILRTYSILWSQCDPSVHRLASRKRGTVFMDFPLTARTACKAYAWRIMMIYNYALGSTQQSASRADRNGLWR